MDAGLLVSDGLDEIEHLKEISSACRMQSKSLSFTIAPTLNCNFRCPYCYEDGKRYGSMSDQCVDQVIKHINGMALDNQADSLQIAWYAASLYWRLRRWRRLRAESEVMKSYLTPAW